MSSTHQTSAGHALSGSGWLDAHFASAQTEYEASLRSVGIQPGWKVLDAGCGGGGFLPLICEFAGPTGSVVALDLAPENIASVEAAAHANGFHTTLQTRVGSVLELPFAEASFDCVWSANVMQYLSEAQFIQAMSEFQRVLRPGGTLALKDYEYMHLEFTTMDRGIQSRFLVEHRAWLNQRGILGGFCGTSLPSRLRRAGLLDIRRKGWLAERWAPLPAATCAFIPSLIHFLNERAQTYDLPEADKSAWRSYSADPDSLMDDPDFCFREFFVVAVGRKP